VTGGRAALVSWAPFEAIEQFRKRMGWTLPWYFPDADRPVKDHGLAGRPARGRLRQGRRTGHPHISVRRFASSFWPVPRPSSQDQRRVGSFGDELVEDACGMIAGMKETLGDLLCSRHVRTVRSDRPV
jgi:hypothetical protein